MNVPRMMRLGVLVALSLCPVAAMAKAEAHGPVAIVYSLAGKASLIAPGAASRPLRLFDRLPAGMTVEVGPGSRLALAFVNGLRYELGERSRVKLGPKDLTSHTGSVRALPRVPPLPFLLPITAKDRPGPRAGAVRIRAEMIAGLYPRRGAATLAEETVLRFDTVAGASSYQVEIQDSQGRTVFRADVESPPVKVTSGRLVAGVGYLWTVRTLDRPGAAAHGEAAFIALDESAAWVREEAHKILEAEKPGSLPLLAEIDRSLGLLIEAREELQVALDSEPADPMLREMYSKIDLLLKDDHNSKQELPSLPSDPDPAGNLIVSRGPRCDAPAQTGPEEGAVVEEVSKGWAAERAGIRSCDLLLSWSRGEENSGPVRSPFDLGQLEMKQAPLGIVTLRGIREGVSREWILPPGRWGLKVRPTFPEALLALYKKGSQRIASGDFEKGTAYWLSAVEVFDRRKDSLRASWLQARLAWELSGAGKYTDADAALMEAVHRLEESQPAAAAQILRDWYWSDTSYYLRRNIGDREEALFRCLAAREPEESLAAAWDLSFLARIARDRGDYTTAEDLNHKAYAIQEKLAPGGVLAWTIQRELAKIAFRRGDLSGEEKALLKALESQERLAPESLELAVVLNELGRHAFNWSNLSTGEKFSRRALALIERLSPDGPEFAIALASLGELHFSYGELAIAEEHLRHALALLEELAPESFEVAYYSNRLEFIAEERGDSLWNGSPTAPPTPPTKAFTTYGI
jgi:tetratricopeptide (TPR) repeat protein